MPTVPCPVHVSCPCSDSPISNFSVEDPDARRFLGVRYVADVPHYGTTVENNYIALGCMGICYSEESQEDANLCAQRQASLCVWDDWTDEDGNPVTIYYNNQQWCPAFCPDGTVFYSSVPAHVFAALSQASADAKALSYACIKALVNMICITQSEREGCTGSYFECILTAAGAHTLVAWTVSGVPAGLSFASHGSGLAYNQAKIYGTPTGNGLFTVHLIAVDGNGDYTAKAVQLRFLEITNVNPLADATIGTAYSYQMTASGGSGNYTWSITDGALPDGLTMDSSGLITGTPTTEESATFTVKVCDNNF